MKVDMRRIRWMRPLGAQPPLNKTGTEADTQATAVVATPTSEERPQTNLVNRRRTEQDLWARLTIEPINATYRSHRASVCDADLPITWVEPLTRHGIVGRTY